MATEWVDTTGLVAVAGEARSADFNSVLQNLDYLYDPPRCAVRLQSPFDVPDSADTAIEWDEAVWDSHGDMWDPDAPSRIQITRAGVYAVICTALWDEEGTNRRALFLEVTGDRRTGQQQAASEPIEHALVRDTNMLAGDYVEIVARQNSGGTRQLIPVRTVMTVRWVAAAPETGE